MIRDTPSWIYYNALPFSPSSSWLRTYYGAELSRGVKVIKGLPVNQSSCLRTVSLVGCPQALAYWKDLIAIGLRSHDIIVLDEVTGTCTFVLSGHYGPVGSLAFSSGGTFLVSGSADSTIKYWDVQTGGVVKTFYGQTGWVRAVAISPDLTTIVSGSDDGTVCLRDVQTGECRCVMNEYYGSVSSVSFSPTNTRSFLFASEDHTVRELDLDGCQIGHTFEGDHVAFSPDGSRFVSWRGGVVTVRASGSGTVVSELQVSRSDLQHCCLSPDGKLVAGAFFHTINVWDITSPDPCLIETFVGHTGYITSLVFSSSFLISSSVDKSIKFWRISASSTDLVPTGLEHTPPTSTPIECISLQANDGIAISSDLAGVVRVWDIVTGICGAFFKSPNKDPDLMDMRLIDGCLIIVWWTSRGIHIWDSEKRRLQVVDMQRFGSSDLRVSGDGRIFLLGRQSVQAWSIRTGEMTGEVRFDGGPSEYPLILDGSRVWVRFGGPRTQGWDFGSPGSTPVPLSSLSPPRHRLDFIDHDLSGIEDTFTGEEVFRLHGRYEKPTVAKWDGRYLVAGYYSGEVLILDFERMIPE